MNINTRVQLRQLVESMAELDPSARSHAPTSTNPLIEWVDTLAQSGLSTKDELAELNARVASHKSAWGDAASSTLSPSQLAAHPFLEATKIYALAASGINPKEVSVSERFVSAKGTVDGQAIADREVFVQQFSPKGEKSGELIVVSPGFMETGRNFYEQIGLMLAQGHEVAVMDHQWAGYTSGEPGGLDRLYGAGRDIVAVLADVEARHPGRKVTVLGNSMGGAAALAAVVLSEQGRVALEGDPKLPNAPKLVLQAPFFEMNDWWLNKGLSFIATKPLLRPLAQATLPATGLPVIVDPTDAPNARKTSEWALLNVASGKLETLARADEDLKDLEAQLGKVDLKDRVSIVIGNKDRLASVEGARRFATKIGVPEHRFRVIPSANHVMEQSPRDQKHAIELFNELRGAPTHPAR